MNVAHDKIMARLGEREFVVMISMLMALTALAIDMMLPAFVAMRSDFGVDEGSSAVAPVVTVFLLGLGAGQPLWGPLSDALGRKRILWIGLAIYLVGALGAAFAPSLGVLLLWRFAAGFGAGAVRVVAHGVVRDAYQGERMAKVLSYIMAVFILIPVVAPSMGTVVLVFGSWRAIFGVLVVFALLAGLWATRLPETLPRDRRISLHLPQLAAATKVVLTNRFTMGLTLAQMFVFGFFVSYLATSELIIGEVFGLAPWFPLFFGGSALVFGAGMLLNPRLLDRFGLRRQLRYALTGYVAASSVFAATALLTGGTPPFWLFLVTLMPVLLAHAFVIPNLNSAAMMPMGNVAGTAAAVIGTIVTLGGAAMGALIDRAFDGTITPLALAGLILCLVGYAWYRWADASWDELAERQVVPGGGMVPPAPAIPSEPR